MKMKWCCLYGATVTSMVGVFRINELIETRMKKGYSEAEKQMKTRKCVALQRLR